MNIQKLLLATLGGAVTLYFSGFLIWGFALDALHQEHTNTFEGLRLDPPNMLTMAFAMVVFAFLIALIFNRWASISTFKSGAIAGAIIAMLAGFHTDLMNMSFLNLYDWVVVVSQIFGNLAWGAIGGGVIGWILGRGN